MLPQAHLHEERRLRPYTFLCSLKHPLLALSCGGLPSLPLTHCFSHLLLPLTPVLWPPCRSCFCFCPSQSLGLHMCAHTNRPHTTWFRVPPDPVLYTDPTSRYLSPLLCPFIDPSFPYPVFLPPSPPLSLGTLSHLRGLSGTWWTRSHPCLLVPSVFLITLYHHDVHSQPQGCLRTGLS